MYKHVIDAAKAIIKEKKIRKFTNALRGPDYGSQPCMCIQGVLCETFLHSEAGVGHEGWRNVKGAVYTFGGCRGEMPDVVKRWAGIGRAESVWLIIQNDDTPYNLIKILDHSKETFDEPDTDEHCCV